jgi:hypothetical protein
MIKMALIRVLEIPDLTADFLFSGGKPFTFIQLDWFRDDGYPIDGTAEKRTHLTEFIKKKGYYKEGRAYLVLHPIHPFVIGYEAP